LPIGPTSSNPIITTDRSLAPDRDPEAEVDAAPVDQLAEHRGGEMEVRVGGAMRFEDVVVPHLAREEPLAAQTERHREGGHQPHDLIAVLGEGDARRSGRVLEVAPAPVRRGDVHPGRPADEGRDPIDLRDRGQPAGQAGRGRLVPARPPPGERFCL
jgi:hypothetical protein